MIKKESIENLKNHLDVVDVISQFLELKKTGANFKACCPFHGETTPSFVVSPAKQIYHCFGCGVGGDSIKFVMEYEKLSYPETIEKLASMYNFNLDYDLLTKKGNLLGKLTNGHLLENNFVTLVNQLAKVELTKEVYETFDINTKINDRILTSDLIMKSQNTQLNIKDSILDLEKNLIDAKINTTIKDKTLDINLKGETSSPQISLDAKDLLKEQINKKIEKKKDKIQQKLNKALEKAY